MNVKLSTKNNIKHEAFHQGVDMKKSNFEKALGKLEKAKIVIEECYSGCFCCIARELTETVQDSGSDGYVFYTLADAYYAVRYAKLSIYYSCNVFNDESDEEDEENDETREMAARICNIMGLAGLTTEWSGSGNARLWVNLKPKDVNHIQGLIDRHELKEREAEAAEFRIRSLFFRWRRTAFRRRISRKRLAPAIVNWAFRPGGPISNTAKKEYQKIQIARQLLASPDLP